MKGKRGRKSVRKSRRQQRRRTRARRNCMRGGRRSDPTSPSIEGFPYVSGEQLYVNFPGGSLPIDQYRAAAAAGELELQN